ncbi:PhnD/SsuA/transferrin family substrate-binding protein [Thiosulfativibrio zosterae]|uniref:Phosphonate ABC transporter substrate-binding protein n=1 Tax=Thiosulfativibrio zosterae TaxID=2675053 RepID=A0A6F8PKM3_9GAMM|nr:PhnD/SsuA/transferrin family substrate-binding protein [Thiosulfativibrio zosterae]BBP42649.1 hypothetical protein THMIRHAT_03950 [Thiosulfativibrio zosterae]
MKRNLPSLILLIVSSLLSLFIVRMAAAAETSPLFFAPLPLENAQVSMAKSQKLADFLSQVIGQPVEPKFYKSYESILNDLAAGNLAFAELGPFNFYKLKQQTSAIQPLAFIRHYASQEGYRCVLASAIDGVSTLKMLDAEAHPSVLLTQPLSTCGWFASEYFFRKAGMDLNQYAHPYEGSHEGVALALLRKEGSVGSLADFMAQRYQGLGLEVLEISPPLPFFSMVANTQLVSTSQLQAISQRLVDLTATETQGWGLGEHGFLAFDAQLQASFETMITEMQPDLGRPHE